ncbi:DNA-binding protein [Vibrio splendidus]|uniref:DNA-binding protein n=1 Tax=Vibrio splendidus TaxID=29497 RepID=A0A2T5EJY1_VIBSP|nr:H-NS family nucleoid-associated regulatory protein [Vibrio splendidus]PTP20654.1 DNA-binding protein [Vibrio splendidus]
MNLAELLQNPDLLKEQLANLGDEERQQATALLQSAVQDAEIEAKKKKEEAHKELVKKELDATVERIELSGVTFAELVNEATAQRLYSNKGVTKASRPIRTGERSNAITRPQYRIVIDEEEFIWTGKGRSPKVFAEAKEHGQLDQYRMTEEEVEAYMFAHPEKYGL